MSRAWIAFACLVAAGSGGTALACDYTSDMPPRVAPLRDRALSKERYSELAKAWREYIDRHPDAAIGYAYLWRARRYAQEAVQNEGMELIQKAYAIDPECPLVLLELSYLQFGESLHSGKPRMQDVLALSRKAIALAPDWYEPHINLLSHALVFGDEADARRQLEAILRKGGIPSPLLDYGYNLLVSTEPGAILLTNGDNDTFPTLAVQLVHGVRPDVRVVNLSLLNLADYVRSTLVATPARPGPFTAPEIDALVRVDKDSPKILRQLVVEELAKKFRDGALGRPLCFATTVPMSHFETAVQRPLALVGLVYEVRPGTGPDPAPGWTFDEPRTDSLLTHVYRLQSATDFAYAWSEESPASGLVMNYFGTYYRLAEARAAAGDLPGVRRALGSAIDLLRFHPELRHRGDKNLLVQMLDYWQKQDPENQEVQRLRNEAKN
jgi:tetratricopeptide (TPR) repeat protein